MCIHIVFLECAVTRSVFQYVTTPAYLFFVSGQDKVPSHKVTTAANVASRANIVGGKTQQQRKRPHPAQPPIHISEEDDEEEGEDSPQRRQEGAGDEEDMQEEDVAAEGEEDEDDEEEEGVEGTSAGDDADEATITLVSANQSKKISVCLDKYSKDKDCCEITYTTQNSNCVCALTLTDPISPRSKPGDTLIVPARFNVPQNCALLLNPQNDIQKHLFPKTKYIFPEDLDRPEFIIEKIFPIHTKLRFTLMLIPLLDVHFDDVTDDDFTCLYDTLYTTH